MEIFQWANFCTKNFKFKKGVVFLFFVFCLEVNFFWYEKKIEIEIEIELFWSLHQDEMILKLAKLNKMIIKFWNGTKRTNGLK